MKIVDYDALGLQSVIGYFRQNKDIITLLKMISQRFSELQNVLLYLLDILSIKSARGIWLDYAGTEVGATRDETDYGNFFCVNMQHINLARDFYFMTSGLNPKNPVTLQDREFIQKIMAHILGNMSAGTLEEILATVKTVTDADNVFILRGDSSGIKLNLVGSNIVLTRNTMTYIKQIIGSGIYLEEVTVNG